MNVLKAQDERSFESATRARLLGIGFEELEVFSKSVASLLSTLETLKDVGDDNTRRRLDRLIRQVEGFEPSATMIGQIKSGKTSLVNAIVGARDLLPADVNPWTSVVTSLHLHPDGSGVQERASFQFFDTDEWERLISGGGRLGELASRTGADDELERIKQQISEMRTKSRERLGRKFEMLLGQRRDYGYINRNLIERFVCLGNELDDEETKEGTEEQGYFADVTKSADLTMQRTSLPLRLCLRDTPGVNDTFMMREQVTIRAIRDSRICVVVLTAHQALSSSDMAIIRLISQVKSRDVIIFVNRIDELSDPSNQVPQIRTSIEETLKKHQGPQEAQLIFGSALWANLALHDALDDLPKVSSAAFKNWAISRSDAQHEDFDMKPVDRVEAWRLSGVPELQAAIADRIVQGTGAALLQRVGASGHNLASGLAAVDALGNRAAVDRTVPHLDCAEARAEMMRISSEQSADIERCFDDIIVSTRDRMMRAQDNFLDRATSALIRHLEIYGEQSPWTYDPTGLRLLLSSSHKVFGRKVNGAFEAVAERTADRIARVCANRFGVAFENIRIIPPRPPRVPPPVSLGRTIALDLNASWWKRWWLQRRGYSAYAESFRDLIKSETDPVISELINEVANGVKQDAFSILRMFMDEQQTIFETLENMQATGTSDVGQVLKTHGMVNNTEVLENTLQTLSEYAVHE